MTRVWGKIRSGTLVATALILAGPFAQPARAQWPQWGGPNRDFLVASGKLADSWPDKGPKKLWRRKLGDGYSSIIVDDGVLYTLYRKTRTNPFEYIAALNATNGRTIWKHKVRSPIPPSTNTDEWTFGPNSTPLVAGDRLYATTAHAVLHCLDKRTGKVIWEHNLGGDINAPLPDCYGYSPSPLMYGNTVIVPAAHDSIEAPGGTAGTGATAPATQTGTGNHTLVAFNRETGEVVWKSGRFTVGHSSPITITFNGKEQLVLFAKDGLLGFDPNNGNPLWQHPLRHNATNDAVVTPLWNGSDLIFCVSHGSESGGRMIRLTEKEGKTVSEELWFNRKAFFGNMAPARVGDHLYGEKGKIITCLDMRTGRIVWRKREFENATCMSADGKLIILDMNGQLGLATATSEGLIVHARSQVLERIALTPPTLVGTTLYLRDRKYIVALDLG
jgi:outer membrane protein assembly factor BamB